MQIDRIICSESISLVTWDILSRAESMFEEHRSPNPTRSLPPHYRSIIWTILALSLKNWLLARKKKNAVSRSPARSTQKRFPTLRDSSNNSDQSTSYRESCYTLRTCTENEASSRVIRDTGESGSSGRKTVSVVPPAHVARGGRHDGRTRKRRRRRKGQRTTLGQRVK